MYWNGDTKENDESPPLTDFTACLHTSEKPIIAGTFIIMAYEDALDSLPQTRLLSCYFYWAAKTTNITFTLWS